jgi:signal transduction histidine kinase
VEVARDRVEAFLPAAAEAGIEVSLSAPDAAQVACPPGVAARILDELLGNALGYATGRIDVAIGAMDRRVELSVGDDGPGLPEAEREQVFTRFVRGSGARPGGSGLGLALVKESAVAAGGSVRARSAAAGGLEILVILPKSPIS